MLSKCLVFIINYYFHSTDEETSLLPLIPITCLQVQLILLLDYLFCCLFSFSHLSSFCFHTQTNTTGCLVTSGHLTCILQMATIFIPVVTHTLIPAISFTFPLEYYVQTPLHIFPEYLQFMPTCLAMALALFLMSLG